eukprot:g20468.t1
MSKTGSGADLRKFMEKRLDLKLTANRHVVGVLRGYDQFMNIVLDNTVEIVSPTEKNEIGMVVIRGTRIDQRQPGEMSKTGSGADLRKFMEKRLDLKLTANRHVVGVLRGYDQFMNIVLDNTVEIVSPTEKNEIGMVVIRGNSIMMWECLDRDWGFQHFAQAARDAEALRTAGLSLHLTASPPLRCAAFRSESLVRRLQPLPEDCAAWRGLDLRALNQLHEGQRSVDVWHLKAAGLLSMSSNSLELGEVDWYLDQEVEGTLQCHERFDGLLLWLEPCQAPCPDCYDALVSDEPLRVSDLRHHRFGVLVVPQQVPAGEVFVHLRLRRDGDVEVLRIEKKTQRRDRAIAEW